MKEKIHCGICSFGMSGRVFHGPLLDAHPLFKLHSVLERSERKAHLKYPKIVSYKSYPELLTDPDTDLIIVNVPDHLHYEFALKALQAGKPVVVEKPFTLKVSQGEELIHVAREKNLGLYVFQNRRFDSDFLSVQDVIRSGKMGRIIEFEAHYDRYRPIPPTDTWKEDRELGPGLIYNLGSHLIDQALVLFGMPGSVFADLDCLRNNGQINDYFVLTLFYPGHRVILRSSYLVKEQPFKYMIHGEKGSFIKKGQDPQEERLNEGWTADHSELGVEASESYGLLFTPENPDGLRITSRVGNYLQFYDDVAADLKGQTGRAVSGEDGLRVIRIIEAALESNQSGKRVNISNQ